jgi:hypothetical protein
VSEPEPFGGTGSIPPNPPAEDDFFDIGPPNPQYSEMCTVRSHTDLQSQLADAQERERELRAANDGLHANIEKVAAALAGNVVLMLEAERTKVSKMEAVVAAAREWAEVDKLWGEGASVMPATKLDGLRKALDALDEAGGSQ